MKPSEIIFEPDIRIIFLRDMVAALHYLLKPVREEKLLSVLDRAAYKLRAERKGPDF